MKVKTYDVHTYRVIRYTYRGVKAKCHEEAALAVIARDINEADESEDYGDHEGATVDVVNDKNYYHSKNLTAVDLQIYEDKQAAKTKKRRKSHGPSQNNRS